jgi:hypothetical protein
VTGSRRLRARAKKEARFSSSLREVSSRKTPIHTVWVGVGRVRGSALTGLAVPRQKERPPRSGLRTALARETGRRFIVWLILCVRLRGNVLRCGDGEGCACCLDNAVIQLRPPLRKSTAEEVEWAPTGHGIGARWCIGWEHDLVAFAVEHQINDLGHAGAPGGARDPAERPGLKAKRGERHPDVWRRGSNARDGGEVRAGRKKEARFSSGLLSVVVGRIFCLDAVGPQDRPWMWAGGHNGDIRRAAHGYEPTREAAMAAFAKSWRRK